VNMPSLDHSRRSRRLLAASLAISALVVAACSTDPAADIDRDNELPREAAGSSVGWTVPASKGGNGRPDDEPNVADCIKRITDQAPADYTLCTVIENRTRRLTATPNVFGVFPLTVSRYWNNRSNAELGGEKVGSHYGRVGGLLKSGIGFTKDCGAQCVGRLTPNPFNKTGMMSFVGLDGSVFEISGITTRLFVTSGEAPMSTTHVGAQPYYDMPAWSSTNYRWCNNGEFLACEVVSAPDKGTSVVAQYRVTNRPLDVVITANVAPGTILQRVGNPAATGFLLDKGAESANASLLKGGEIARYGGYRATDDRTSNVSVTYVVGDAAGNITAADCAAEPNPVLGCGTTIVVSVVIDKDGKFADSNCLPTNSTSRRTFKCDKPVVTGDNSAPMTATVNIRDF
jgi:hypothetical protein